MMDVYEKLRILADSAKFDVSCSSSGSHRSGRSGCMGNAAPEGICHSWAADGRCISLLKVLFTNKCVFNCEYCVNRRTADCERATFEPRELADLTMEFYKRNYIEGLFLSSAVDISPDHTAERILECLRLLRDDYGFCGYIHAKIIPGVNSDLTHALGLYADRLSVNLELPSRETLALLAPQKKPEKIFSSMRQITNTLIERNSLVAPGTMFKGQDINTPDHYIGGVKPPDFLTPADAGLRLPRGAQASALPQERLASPALPQKSTRKKGGLFAPAGQTTQMIIGASGETDRQILQTSASLYNIFKMKRVYFSAYIPITDSPLLPGVFTAPPLAREHRLYQADWLLRFYGFNADEILEDSAPNLDLELDPKINWALRHIERFPIEINKASLDELMRIPGIGYLSAKRIIHQRGVRAIRYEDLKPIGVVLKRAKYFITCSGKYYGRENGLREPDPLAIRQIALSDERALALQSYSYLKPGTFEPSAASQIRDLLLGHDQGEQLSMFSN